MVLRRLGFSCRIWGSKSPIVLVVLWQKSHLGLKSLPLSKLYTVFGRPLGQAYAIENPSVRPSVCNVGGLWPNGLSDRDDFWHTPCPGQQ